MDILAKFKRNDDLIVNGAKMRLDASTWIGIARMHDSNPQFKKVSENIARQQQSRIDATKDEKERNELFGELATEAFAQVCVTGWSNITMGGEVLECNEMNILRIRKELPELWDEMLKFAMNSANYVGTFNEADSLKN